MKRLSKVFKDEDIKKLPQSAFFWKIKKNDKSTVMGVDMVNVSLFQTSKSKLYLSYKPVSLIIDYDEN